MSFLSALFTFIQTLPELLKLYYKLKNVFGDNWDKFLADVDTVEKIVVDSRNPDISLEEKRKLRREALDKGRDLWSRVGV